MKALKFFEVFFAKTEKGDKNLISDEKDSRLAELIANVRNAWRKASVQVSASMDTAVVAGGLDKSVKAIQTKTNDLHNQISDASSAIE